MWLEVSEDCASVPLFFVIWIQLQRGQGFDSPHSLKGKINVLTESNIKSCRVSLYCTGKRNTLIQPIPCSSSPMNLMTRHKRIPDILARQCQSTSLPSVAVHQLTDTHKRTLSSLHHSAVRTFTLLSLRRVSLSAQHADL